MTVEQGNSARAGFLQGLIKLSGNCFAEKACIVSPCSAVDAYFLFVAITGCLSVDIDMAAKVLERVVRERERRKTFAHSA